MLVERFGFPWQHVAPRHLTHFYSVFTADETVPLGTWQATPFEVTAMLEKGFRGSPLTPDQLILTWNGKPLASGVILPSPGLSQTLCKALRGAVAVTAPQAGLHEPAWLLAAKTGTTDGGRDAWFAGFLLTAQPSHQATIYPRITFVVWAGYDDNRPAGLYGGHVHGPILGRFLSEKPCKRPYGLCSKKSLEKLCATWRPRGGHMRRCAAWLQPGCLKTTLCPPGR
jgi:hypothetical protein